MALNIKIEDEFGIKPVGKEAKPGLSKLLKDKRINLLKTDKNVLV